MLMAEERPTAVEQNCAVGDYGQTVGDMNKSHNTDPPQVGVALSTETKIVLVGGAP